jgi:hypothetical protein
MAYEARLIANLPSGPTKVGNVRIGKMANAEKVVAEAKAKWGDLLIRVELWRTDAKPRLVQLLYKNFADEFANVKIEEEFGA